MKKMVQKLLPADKEFQRHVDVLTKAKVNNHPHSMRIQPDHFDVEFDIDYEFDDSELNNPFNSLFDRVDADDIFDDPHDSLLDNIDDEH